MLPTYLANIIARAQYEEPDAERIHTAREERTLLIDLMLEDAGIENASEVYPPPSGKDLADLFKSLLHAPQLQRDLVAYYVVLDISDDIAAKEFATSRHLTQIHTSRVRGLWSIDQGRLDEAARLLSTPGVWSGFSYDERIKEYQDAVLDVLVTEGTPALVNAFMEGSGMRRDSPGRRECSVRALALEEGRMREAWRYVRDLEFEDEMEPGEEGEDVVEDGMEVDEGEDEVERRVRAVQDERKRLLAVLLDAILIPQPHKTALQALLKLPIDNFEQKFLTSYLLNTTSSLPTSSFSLLHDLLTLRFCSRGQHANAIELDRQVAERIRERPELSVGHEGRANVQAMVELLPEVQRKMLLVERDAANVDEASTRKQAEMVQASTLEATPARPATFTRPSFAPLSASVQLRQSTNPRNAIYQALLRSTSSSSLTGDASARSTQRYLPSDHAPASSRRQLNTSTFGGAPSMRVPYGGQQTQFPSSPFNLPPRVPVGFSSVYAQSVGMSVGETMDEEMYDDGSVTPREARSASPHGGFPLQDDADREDTPVARESQQEIGYEDDEQQQDGYSEPPDEPMDTEGHSEESERRDKVAEPGPEIQPAKAKRARREPSEPAASPPATRTIAKTPRRTRKQREASQPANETEQQPAVDDQAIPIPGAFPTATRAKRKLRSSSQFEAVDQQQEMETKEPRAKKTRKGVNGTAAARRATRSQSVASQATTEADHEDTSVRGDARDTEPARRRPQRRSARLSESTAPSSPARSEAASTTASKGPRTRKAAGTTPKKAAPLTRGVRTRRQAAALEEEDEE